MSTGTEGSHGSPQRRMPEFQGLRVEERQRSDERLWAGGRGRNWHSVLLKDLKEGFTRHLAKHTLTVSKPNKTKRSGPVLETISDVNRGVLEYLNLSA